ncbi:MAG: EamA family transporter RarD [Gammaproteobacteria bacterium]
MNKGIVYAVAAYVIWGLLPVYLKWLHAVPALQVISHRIVWACLLLGGIIVMSRQWRAFKASVLVPRILRIYLIAALLIAINWLTYVWAVNAGFIVEVSLGYFINPVISVVMGVIFLHERLRPWQWLPVAMVVSGVLYLTVSYGALPWLALVLAFSFGTYGLIKKTAPLGALYGLTLETGILLLPALAYLIYADATGQGAFLHAGGAVNSLLIAAGPVTALPLLLFAAAAQRIPLTLVGILQYIAPTLQFLLGVLVYHEPFSHAQLIGYGIVWAALIIFAMEGLHASRTQAVAINY